MRIKPLTLATRRIIPTPKFKSHSSGMADTMEPRFSEGEDKDRLMIETTALLKSKWTLDEAQQGLEKTFNFPSYAKALVSHSWNHRD